MVFFSCKTRSNCGCGKSDLYCCCNINYIRDMLIPILILVLAWFGTGVDNRYHLAALVFLILALFLLAIFTW